MHPRSHYSCYDCPRQKEYTLEELKDKVTEITEAIKYISECELSESVKNLAINELKEKKAHLKELMHKKVDEL